MGLGLRFFLIFAFFDEIELLGIKKFIKRRKIFQKSLEIMRKIW